MVLFVLQHECDPNTVTHLAILVVLTRLYYANPDRIPRLGIRQSRIPGLKIQGSENTENRRWERIYAVDSGHVMTDLRTTLDPEHLDELLLLRSFNKLKGSIA